MKTQTLSIDKLTCVCCRNPQSEKVAYILFPMDNLEQWAPLAAEKYATSIVVVTGIDWDDDLTPWPAPGVPKGSPDFKGLAPQFLTLIAEKVVPQAETAMGLERGVVRSLVGVSLSGLFALWQWPQSALFQNIATLSGSYWYQGFTEWVSAASFADKAGKCFMLLGSAEVRAKTGPFASVGDNTQKIADMLREKGVDVTYTIVPGNHYQHLPERLDLALSNI